MGADAAAWCGRGAIGGGVDEAPCRRIQGTVGRMLEAIGGREDVAADAAVAGAGATGEQGESELDALQHGVRGREADAALEAGQIPRMQLQHGRGSSARRAIWPIDIKNKTAIKNKGILFLKSTI